MSTWAIFNDEGLCEELNASDRDEADAEFKTSEWTGDEHAHVGEMCREHYGHEAWSCENCNADDDEPNTECADE